MSDLVERVARQLCVFDGESDPDRMLQIDTPIPAWRVYEDEARAAIREVAAWLDEVQKYEYDKTGDLLRSELKETK